MFGAYLVRYVPEEKATSGFRARLESMSQFGEKYASVLKSVRKFVKKKHRKKMMPEESTEETTED